MASDLIRDAVAATRWHAQIAATWRVEPEPARGLITFVDPGKTRRKRDPGRCYLRAGFRYAGHWELRSDCAVCEGLRAKRGARARGCGLSQEEGHIALEMLPADMPAPVEPMPAIRRAA